MLYIVDGTGPDNFSDYMADMRRGFCWHLSMRHGAAATYLRGPTELGLETWEIADLMHASVKADLARDGATQVVLAGHSRGGAAVMHLARRLEADGIAVPALLLFDAVRRALQKSPLDYGRQIIGSGVPDLVFFNAASAVIEITADFFQIGSSAADQISGNVGRALHLVRDERFSNFFVRSDEYRGLAKDVKAIVGPVRMGAPSKLQRLRKLDQLHRRMRDACRFDCIKLGVSTGFSFANTGLQAEGACRLKIVPVMATHGAMGGAPLRASDYVDEPVYATQIEAQETRSMLRVRTLADAFLQEFRPAIAAGAPLTR